MTAVAEARLPPRPDGLDPRLADLIEALARDAARQDHRAAGAARDERQERNHG